MRNKERLDAEYGRLVYTVFGSREETEKEEAAIQEVARFLVRVGSFGTEEFYNFAGKSQRLIEKVLKRDGVDILELLPQASEQVSEEIAGRDFSYFEAELKRLRGRMQGRLKNIDAGQNFYSTASDISQDADIVLREIAFWANGKNFGKSMERKVKRLCEELGNEIAQTASVLANYGPPEKPEWAVELEERDGGLSYLRNLLNEKIGQDEGEVGENDSHLEWFFFLKGRLTGKVYATVYKPRGPDVPVVDFRAIDDCFELLPEHREKAVVDLVNYMRSKEFSDITGYRGAVGLAFSYPVETRVASGLKIERCMSTEIKGRPRVCYRVELDPGTPVGNASVIQGQGGIFIPNKREIARHLKRM